jgi:hypothetical protein
MGCAESTAKRPNLAPSALRRPPRYRRPASKIVETEGRRDQDGFKTPISQRFERINQRFARMACKPDSVPGFPPWMTIPLPHRLPGRSSCQPGPWAEASLWRSPSRGKDLSTQGPYSALLRVGLAIPSRLPGPWWALTPPFHHRRGCRLEPKPLTPRQTFLCGAFPEVALAGGYPAPLLHGVRTFLEACAPRSSSHPRDQRLKHSPARCQRQSVPPDPAPCRHRPGPAAPSPRAGTAAGTP